MDRARIAFRCDGDATIGAGHVARCLPLARAFAERGAEVAFAGRYDGLAAWLLEGMATAAFEDADWDAAVVDLYGAGEAALCELAARLPLATIGEADRCPDAGVWIDYHLDRAGEPATDRLLPGPEYALIDPAFAEQGRDRTGPVRTALVTLGGAPPEDVAREAVARLHDVFPDARVLLASGVQVDGAESLPYPSTLLDAVGEVDVAVSAAGVTAYELACAGVPAALVQIADNQRRVYEGALRAGFATDGVEKLRDPEARRALQQAGPQAIDGRGAAKAADALAAIWSL